MFGLYRSGRGTTRLQYLHRGGSASMRACTAADRFQSRHLDDELLAIDRHSTRPNQLGYVPQHGSDPPAQANRGASDTAYVDGNPSPQGRGGRRLPAVLLPPPYPARNEQTASPSRGRLTRGGRLLHWPLPQQPSERIPRHGRIETVPPVRRTNHHLTHPLRRPSTLPSVSDAIRRTGPPSPTARRTRHHPTTQPAHLRAVQQRSGLHM